MKAVEEESFGIIPLRENKGVWEVLLILHQGGRHWAFPKGHGNLGETPLESACRELTEETGLEVQEIIQEQPLKEHYRFYRKQGIVSKRVQYFPAKVSGLLKLQEEEIQDAKWVSLQEAVHHVTFKEARNMCQKLIRLLNIK